MKHEERFPTRNPFGMWLGEALTFAEHPLSTPSYFSLHRSAEPDSGANLIKAVAGEHRLDFNEEGEQVRNVSQIVLHDGWSSTTFENDIAILVLDEPLQLDNYTRSMEITKGGEIHPGNFRASVVAHFMNSN